MVMEGSSCCGGGHFFIVQDVGCCKTVIRLMSANRTDIIVASLLR